MPCAQSLLVWPQNQPTMVSQFEPQNRARGPGATGMRSGCNSGSFKVGGGTPRDRGACVGGKQGRSGCVSAQ
jgi:hypothetical protein